MPQARDKTKKKRQKQDCHSGLSQAERENSVDVLPGDFFVNLLCDVSFFKSSLQPLRQVALIFSGAVIQSEQ